MTEQDQRWDLGGRYSQKIGNDKAKARTNAMENTATEVSKRAREEMKGESVTRAMPY